MPTFLAFGDSNTHGTAPQDKSGHYDRYPPGTRWPTVAHKTLPADWHLVEEGLPGRTTCFPDPLMGAHMNGWLGLKIAMMTHARVDLLTIMLGTNDVKSRLGATPEAIAAGMAGLLDILRDPEIIARADRPKVLIIAPPPVLVEDDRAPEWIWARDKGLALPALYAELAQAYGVGFFDAGAHIAVAPSEGIHFTSDAHKTLGAAVGKVLRDMI